MGEEYYMQEIDFNSYQSFFNEVVAVINTERFKASQSLNKHQITVNFELGRCIVRSQAEHGWGKSIVDTLSKDLNKVLDGVRGYSPQNLWYMRQFYLEYHDEPELLELAMKIPWSHNLVIIQKVKDNDARKYYVKATADMAWARAVLINQIKGSAYQRHLIAPKQSNFDKVLPAHFAEQATEALKSEYNLDFLGITGPVLERELENRLTEKVRDLIMELGYGFCYIGNQFPLKLPGKDKPYRVDLLFYHRILKCLVAVDLKTVDFEPEFAGKMSFYLELLDEQEKQIDDKPSIGIILCPEKDDIEVEYALRVSHKPIGVAEYRLTHSLPEQLKGKLPSPEEIKKLLR